MYKFKKIVLILIMLSASLDMASSNSNSSVKSFQKTIPEKLLIYNLSDERNDLFYVVCDPIRNFKTSTTCNVTRETPMAEPSEFSKKSCTLLFPNWFVNANNSISLQGFDHGHVILFNNVQNEE